MADHDDDVPGARRLVVVVVVMWPLPKYGRCSTATSSRPRGSRALCHVTCMHAWQVLYGDFIPTSWLARLMCAMASFMGILITSTIIAIFAKVRSRDLHACNRQADRQAGKQAGRQAGRHAGRQAGTQAGK